MSDEQRNSENVTQNANNTRSISSFISEKKIDLILWLLRSVTFIFGFLYILPFGVNQLNCYQRALAAGAAIHVLRLHQRLGGFRWNLQFLQQMFAEDACHYLLYCVIFLSVHPVTMALIPVFIFAILHWISFSIQLLNVANMSNSGISRLLNKFIADYSQVCLQIIACCEIMMMPAVIFMVLSGRGNLLVPFVYYRFLTLRYLSRRNPSTRQAFHQLRLAMEQTLARPGCPQILRGMGYKIMAMIDRLAPATVQS